MRSYTLDASAVIDFLENGPGAARVEQLISSAHRGQSFLSISVLNWGETFYTLWQHHGEETARREIARLSRFPIEVVLVDEQQALKAGEIKALHKLSFVDCVAAALAEIRKSILVTADRDFQRLGRRIQVLWLARP